MALALCASTGCAANAALQAEVQALRTEVTSLRATAGAMTERLDALEMEGGGLKVAGAPPTPEAAPPSDAPPNLQVVTLKPTTDAITETEAPAQPLETGPRVKIRSTPNGLVQEEVKGDEKDEPSKPVAKKDPPKPPATKKPVQPAPKSPPAPAKP